MFLARVVLPMVAFSAAWLVDSGYAQTAAPQATTSARSSLIPEQQASASLNAARLRAIHRHGQMVAAFDAETVDRAWAATKTQQLQAMLQSLGQRFQPNNIICRRTSCRVEVPLSRPLTAAEERQWLNEWMRREPSTI